MNELKKRQRKQERRANVTEGVFLLLTAGSAYTLVYVSNQKTINFFYVPMFFLLNATMLIAVLVMRFVIKRVPNLLPNENLVIIHVLLFTAVTSIWVFFRVIWADLFKAYDAFLADTNNESTVKYLYASGLAIKIGAVYNTVDILLNLFMLYMLHQFSIFEGFVYDPLTG